MNLTKECERISENLGRPHPFYAIKSKDSYRRVIEQYIVMSESFPFIQSGAIYKNYTRDISNYGNIQNSTEIISSVGSFLIWDEFGCHNIIMKKGESSLVEILKTKDNFHSSILRKDISRFFNGGINNTRANISTKNYLDNLLLGLSDDENYKNVAHMVAFEMHAFQMIQSLWKVTCSIFRVGKPDSLKYFYIHVGGINPAEKYHVEMTEKMMTEIIPLEKRGVFINSFKDAYKDNIFWCQSIVT